MTVAKLTDLKGKAIQIKWMHQPYIAKMTKDAAAVALTGSISHYNEKPTMLNPEISTLSSMPIDSHDSLFGDKAQALFGSPVYKETKGLSSLWLHHTVKKFLSDKLLDSLPDPIPQKTRARLNLPSLKTALIWIHSPQNEIHAMTAQKRFAFEELFLIQAEQQITKKLYESHYTHTYSIEPADIDSFIATWPYKPTGAQARAIKRITTDIISPAPMMRLLQGDVGSGKTAVAAATAYGIISNKPAKQTYGAMQVAYMAPTEVLATQLFEGFIEFFAHMPIKIAQVTGSGCRVFPSKSNPNTWTSVSRSQVSKWIENGEIEIVIGTHALISKKTKFKHLGLIIVDEQHRFGTKQRRKLVEKTDSSPHYLSMSATPIPRTLALTIYGDLELSVLDEMPPGRKTVKTSLKSEEDWDEIVRFLGKQLSAGRQAYAICPRIKESAKREELSSEEKSKKQAYNVTHMRQRLMKEKIFSGARIEVLHSKLKKADIARIMKEFSAGLINVLVSTSVVEVGVNVPNANTIAIFGSDRFGMSQLHQLRGRVIRGTHQPFCFLVPESLKEKGKARMERMVETSDGFVLAEYDLTTRGMGDFAGIKQWGVSDLGMQALMNPKLVAYTKEEAHSMVYENPIPQQTQEILTLREISRVHLE
jgi:ATP-dependent DNA helicase RecG